MSLPDEKVICHRSFGGKLLRCHDGVVKHKCSLWVSVDGTDAMGREVQTHGCVDLLSIKFLHEIAKEVRQNAASTDKVANEVRAASDATAGLQTYMINGLKASFPLMQLVKQAEVPMLEDRGDDVQRS